MEELEHIGSLDSAASFSCDEHEDGPLEARHECHTSAPAVSHSVSSWLRPGVGMGSLATAGGGVRQQRVTGLHHSPGLLKNHGASQPVLSIREDFPDWPQVLRAAGSPADRKGDDDQRIQERVKAPVALASGAPSLKVCKQGVRKHLLTVHIPNECTVPTSKYSTASFFNYYSLYAVLYYVSLLAHVRSYYTSFPSMFTSTVSRISIIIFVCMCMDVSRFFLAHDERAATMALINLPGFSPRPDARV